MVTKKCFSAVQSSGTVTHGANTSIENIVSLTFSPASGEKYVILCGGDFLQASTGHQFRVEFNDATSGALYPVQEESVYTPNNTGDTQRFQYMQVFEWDTPPPATVTFQLNFQPITSGADTLTCKNGTIVALQLDTTTDIYYNGYYYLNNTVDNTDRAGWYGNQFHIDTAGEYLLLASANAAVSDIAARARVSTTINNELFEVIDGVEYGVAELGFKSTDDYIPWIATGLVTLQGNTDYYHVINLGVSDGAYFSNWYNFRTLLVRLTGKVEGWWHTNSVARSTTTSTSMVDKSSLTQILSGAKHFYMGTSFIDGPTTGRVNSEMSVGGVNKSEISLVPLHANSTLPISMLGTLTGAGSTAVKQRFKSSAGETVGSQSSDLIVVQLEPASALEAPLTGLTLNKLTPSVGLSLSIPVKAMTLTSLLPQAVGNQNIPVKALTITAQIPIVSTGASTVAPVTAMTLNKFEPSAPQLTLDMPSTIMSIDKPLPVVQGINSVPVKGLTLTALIPSVVTGGAGLIPVTNMTVGKPILDPQVAGLPPVKTMVLGSLEPTVEESGLNNVPITALTLNKFIPDVIASLQVPAKNMTLVGLEPIIQDSITIPVKTFTVNTYAPDFLVVLVPPVKVMTGTGLAPQIQVIPLIPVKLLEMGLYPPSVTIKPPDAVVDIPITDLVVNKFAPAVNTILNNLISKNLSLVGLAPSIGLTTNAPITALAITSLVPIIQVAPVVPIKNFTMALFSPFQELNITLLTSKNIFITGLSPIVIVAIPTIPVTVLALNKFNPSVSFSILVPTSAFGIIGIVPDVEIDTSTANDHRYRRQLYSTLRNTIINMQDN